MMDSLPPCPKGVIFDLDGTLLDSMFVWSQVDFQFLQKRGYSVPADYGNAIAHLTFRETAEYTIRRFGFSETPEALMAEWNALAIAAYETDVTLKPGAKAYLQKLRTAGIPFAVCTSLSPELYKPVLNRYGILPWFTAIVTTDRVGVGKSCPEPFFAAAESLRLPPAHCLVFEDLPAAVRGAKAAGMRVCGIGDQADQAEEMRRLCDWFLPDFQALSHGELFPANTFTEPIPKFPHPEKRSNQQ